MFDAKWLFENHKWLKAEVSYLRVQIQKKHKAKKRVEAGLSSDVAFSQPGISQVDSSIGQHEINEAEVSQKEGYSLLVAEDVNALKLLLEKYENDLQLYDILLTLFTEQELWLINQYYEQKNPIAQICLMKDNPFNTSCRSTLCRYRDRILKKANAFISANSIKGDQPCLLMQFGKGLKG